MTIYLPVCGQGIPSRSDSDATLPHIVKFSGGRSSAALAILLAEAGVLKPERGDAILFANTSAEHPGTYEFARRCKRLLERDFGIPVLWFEFCTVEDASRGAYSRRPTYRLVRATPFHEHHNPHGYRHEGEVFEEMLSYQGMLPNPHTRSCTAKLKLHPSHQLLAEWLGRTEGPRHAGHFGERSYLEPEEALVTYRKSGGLASDEAYMRRVEYMSLQGPQRAPQRWSDYTEAPVHQASVSAEPAPMWGPRATKHVTLLGLRADEPKRIERVMSRSMFAEGASTARCQVRNQPPGERPCFPLADWGYDANAVQTFWDERGPDFGFALDIPPTAGNCVFCFMKGTQALRVAAQAHDPGRRSNTPSDIGWWIEMERRYARQVPARDGNGLSHFGFFGVRGPTFEDIAGEDVAPCRYDRGVPACDCTD